MYDLVSVKSANGLPNRDRSARIEHDDQRGFIAFVLFMVPPVYQLDDGSFTSPTFILCEP
jgi:hypothetical protein